MRRLVLMRHAKSDWENARLSDHERPLNDRGRRVAPKMGRFLRDQGIQPEVVLASTAVRVQQTLDLVTEKWNPSPEVLTERSLYLADLSGLLAQVRGLHDSWNEVMFVGHNPGISQLASALAKQSIDMPTACVAVLVSEQSEWTTAASDWKLAALWLPRQLFD